MTFSRRPGERFNRGRIATVAGIAAPPSTQDPLSILGANLGRWIEGNRGTSLTMGAPSGGAADAGWVMDQINDQGGTASSNMTSTSGSRPLMEFTSWDGQASWQFDGVNDDLVNADAGTGAHAAAVFNGANKPWSVAMVYQPLITTIGVAYSAGVTTLTTNYIEHYSQAGDLDVDLRNTAGPTKTAKANFTADRTRAAVLMDSDGSNCTIYRMAPGASTWTALTMTTSDIANTIAGVNRDTIGALGRTTFAAFHKMRMAAFVSKKSQMTSGERDLLATYLSKYTIPQTRPSVLIWADSQGLAAGPEGATGWSAQLTATNYDRILLATGGEGLGSGTVTGLSKSYTWVTSTANTSRSVRVYIIKYLVNDIVAGRTGAQLDADTGTAIANIQAADAGAKIIVATGFKYQGFDASMETERQNYNTLIRARVGGNVLLCDGDTLIPEATTDSTIFTASGHLTTLGNSYMANGRFSTNGYNQILTSLGVT